MKNTLWIVCLVGILTSCSNKNQTNTDKNVNIKKWVAVGNSITWHPVNEYWWGEYGMAATKPENDFVHVLNRKFQASSGTDVSFKIAWCVDWERNHNGYDLKYFDSFFNGDEDLIVIRIGENVTSLDNYESDFKSLVQYLKSLAPNARVVVSGIFMSASTDREAKEKIQQNIAISENCIWLPINHLDTKENRNSVGTKVLGKDGLLHRIDNQTVADHPNDEGMIEISDAIFNAL